MFLLMKILNILTWEEFLKECKMNYWQLVEYLKRKYSPVPYDYGKGNESLRGLFIHHTMEWRYADLSSVCGRETFPEFQVAKYLVFCNWLEHLLLHAKIFKEFNSPRRGQEDNGALNFMIPQLYAYLEMGLKASRYSDSYYNNINNEDALKIFKAITLMFIPEYTNESMIKIIKHAEDNLELDGKKCEAYLRIIDLSKAPRHDNTGKQYNIRQRYTDDVINYIRENHNSKGLYSCYLWCSKYWKENNFKHIKYVTFYTAVSQQNILQSVSRSRWTDDIINTITSNYYDYGLRHCYNLCLKWWKNNNFKSIGYSGFSSYVSVNKIVDLQHITKDTLTPAEREIIENNIYDTDEYIHFKRIYSALCEYWNKNKLPIRKEHNVRCRIQKMVYSGRLNFKYVTKYL